MNSFVFQWILSCDWLTFDFFIFETAQVAFLKVGELLQEQRKHDFYELMQYHASSQGDPAGEDESLKKKLDENKKFYKKRMDDVIDKYMFLFV